MSAEAVAAADVSAVPSRTDDAGSPPDPIDWGLAQRVARRVAGREPMASSYLASSLQRAFDEVTATAEQLVAAFTGLRSSAGPARALVLDRPGWVSANVSSFRRLLAPFTRRVGERLAKSPAAPVGRALAGVEMGVLLGFLS